ncbi:hypothetical protein BHM03_00011522 [Ensete ventricosum]|nr:hypothetical protein BHM03_00011522 [Ensete ventricosum]
MVYRMVLDRVNIGPVGPPDHIGPRTTSAQPINLYTSVRGPHRLNLSAWTRQPEDHVGTPRLSGHVDSHLGKRGRAFTQCRLLKGSYRRSAASPNETPGTRESNVQCGAVPTGQPKAPLPLNISIWPPFALQV